MKTIEVDFGDGGAVVEYDLADDFILTKKNIAEMAEACLFNDFVEGSLEWGTQGCQYILEDIRAHNFTFEQIA